MKQVQKIKKKEKEEEKEEEKEKKNKIPNCVKVTISDWFNLCKLENSWLDINFF